MLVNFISLVLALGIYFIFTMMTDMIDVLMSSEEPKTAVAAAKPQPGSASRKPQTIWRSHPSSSEAQDYFAEVER